MGHKKRNVTVRSKTFLPAAALEANFTTGDPAAVVDGGVSSLDQSMDSATKTQAKSETTDLESNSNANPSSSYASVKLECERALTALRRGNQTKALRLMKDMCSKHENSPHLGLIHRVQGTVCVKVASIIDDANAKQRHLKNAIDSARRAVTLAPSSIEFAHFYANLLYEAANEGKEYEEVVQECERALAIENPVDPAKESLQDENQQKISTAEARIAHVKSELRSLIQKSNIVSISTWMKNLGNGEEKFRLIPIRRVPEDPMELRLVQARRPNEIKKVAKTPEERRKEIEVRVAAARLLQQKSESSHLGNDGDNNNNTSKGSGHRGGEIRKSGNVRRTTSSDERRDWVCSYWNSMSLDGKKHLLKIKITDLRAHFNSSTDGSLSEVLNEALAFGEANKIWRFWTCCRCNEKFADAGSFMQHIVQEHMGSLLPKMQSILPQSVDKEWAEMLLKCSWKPLELNAAMGMLGKQSKPDTLDLLDDSCPRNNADDSKECIVDTFSEYKWDSSPGKKKSGHTCNGSVQENGEFEDVEWMDPAGYQGSKKSLLNEKWPLSDDPERAKLLERIHAFFQTLIKHKCLASSHLSKVIRFTVEELQGIASGSQLKCNLDQTPLCICFLGAPELKKIQKFLQEITQACGLNRYSDKSNAGDDSNTVVQGIDVMEKIIFSQDASLLVLDEHFLPCKIPHLSCDSAINNVDSAPTSSRNSYENGVILDSDALLSWIFTGVSSVEQLASWKGVRDEKAQQCQEILQLLEKESYHLQGLCERKCEHLSYEEALQAVEDLCLEEAKKREHVIDYVCQSYDSVLKKRREELIENDHEITIISNGFELDAIRNVLKDAESLNLNQFGFEETYNGVTSHLCDLEPSEDDWRTKDCLHQVDSCVEVAIQRQKEQVSVEISKIDAKIMQIIEGMQQLEAKLEPASSHDFRSILIPLVKSFLRARLEELAEKDATEKSDAAREAFLAELARDSKRGGGTGVDNSKHMHEKTKDRKKSKENRKNRDPKATNGDELRDQTTEEILLSSAHAEEGLGSGIAVPGPDEALRLQEEEQKHRIELEAEERKLEETLEYQRRIENEAKQKHLAKQHKRNSKTGEKTETVTVTDAYLRHRSDDKYANEQWANKTDPLTDNDGFVSILEGVPNNITNGAILRTGFPNEVIPLDGGLYSEWHSGRRGRRHKGPTRLGDGKNLTLVPDKEDSYPGQPSREQNSQDNGVKTLRQLQAEEDDEERFQADLKKAVHQSLGMGNKFICMTKKESKNGGIGSKSKRGSMSKRRSSKEEELLHRQALAMAIQQHQLSQRFDNGSMSRRIGSTSSRRRPTNLSDPFSNTNNKKVCYYGQHYHCFAYSRDHEQWIMYDDKTVKVIGGWNDVLTMCERGHLQPQLLLFEAVN
ncbi:hypothetical protein CDL12_29644 [Handroanthus impetiginosus]|uniref:C2H2-type domain-containing protein n=1 Tax=Handroanthus impetiginosus TaxID=429701 RepID=A0A2G9FYZ1_9LAMI|nr:hypothetical protein CDL12_29644 [Handroanthus impetiginosus]